MSDTDVTEIQLQNLLSAVTDALFVEEETEIDSIVSRYRVPRAEVDSLLKVVHRLHLTLAGVKPTRRFAYRLKSELIGAPKWGVVTRVRHLPPRVQIAAGIALVAGFMLLSRRRLLNDAQEEGKEVAALSETG